MTSVLLNAAGRIRALSVEQWVLERRFFSYRRRRNFLPPPLAGLLGVLRR
jgi:hypothetical protein